MTCPHCAAFQTTVLPELKTKYIDTGKARYILREFPLDNLAVAAFMLARCAGNDRYFPMIDALFATQTTWAVPGADGKDKLLLIARQAGWAKTFGLPLELISAEEARLLFPPMTTVQHYFYRWSAMGLWPQINHALLMMAREAIGREASPSAWRGAACWPW